MRRIYGDFSSSRSRGWTEVLSKHAIIPHQQFAYVTGKNASDIALVIDAMDLCIPGASTASASSPPTATSRAWLRAFASTASTSTGSASRRRRELRQACRASSKPRTCGPTWPPRRPDRAGASVEPMLRQVMDQIETDDGWVALGQFGQRLLNRFSDFDPRTSTGTRS